MKICSKCKISKSEEDFAINNNKSCGRQSYCKLCQKEIRQSNEDFSTYMKQYYENNKAGLLEKQKIYKKNNLEQYREYQKQYRNERRKLDVNFKLNELIRTNIRRVYLLMNTNKSDKSLVIVNYTPDDLKIHIESLFTEKMSWENFGKLWEIDHIIPIKWYIENQDKFSTTKELVRETNRLSNLRPLLKELNRSKSSSYL